MQGVATLDLDHWPHRTIADIGLVTMPQIRRMIVFAATIAALGGCYWLWQSPPPWLVALEGPAPDPNRITVSGNIEAHESLLSFNQVQGQIVELAFDEGAAVKAGTVLARIDDRLYRQQVEIDRANQQIQAAQVQVSEGTLVAAQKTVESDQFDLTEKKLDYERAETLVKTFAASVQTRDLAKTAAAQSAAALSHDQAMVQVAAANLALAHANEAAAAAKLQLDEVTLDYTILRAPFDGVISVREAEIGQLAGPGVMIFTLDDLDHIWLRAYINEQDIGKIRLGEAVDVTTDTYPHKIYRGRISFISDEAEFTPKTVEVHAERVNLVYRIRIDIDNPTHELLPGMPADGSLALLPPGP